MPHCDAVMRPIFTLTFQDMLIAGTGLGEELPRMKQLVGYLGGHFTDELSVNNTHLLASRTDTPMFSAAAERRMPILSPRYVTETWKKQLEGIPYGLTSR